VPIGDYRIIQSLLKKLSTSFLGGLICFLFVAANLDSFSQPGIGINYKETYSPATFPSVLNPINVLFRNQDEFISNVVAFPGTPFKFGGISYSGFYVSSNGWIGLTNLAAGSAAPVGPVPDNTTFGLSNPPAGPVVAPLWDDLKCDSVFWKTFAQGIRVYFYGIHWDHTSSTVYTSIQVSFYLTSLPGRLQFYYKSPYTGSITNLSGGASIGIADYCAGDFYSEDASTYSASTGTPAANKNTETKTITSLPGANVTLIFDPVPPANDSCINAAPVTVVSGSCIPTTGTLIHATKQSSPGALSCTVNDTNDVWYMVTKPQGISSFTLTTDFVPLCRTATTSMEIYPADSTCAQLSASLGCTSTGGSINNNNAQLTLNGLDCSAAHNYLVRIAGDGNATGNFQLCAWSPLTGANCTNPTTICALPYNSPSLNTNGFGNEYNSTNSTCFSPYMNGEDYVFAYTPSVTQCFQISIGRTGLNSNPGLFVVDGCPDDTASGHTHCIASANGVSDTVVINSLALAAGHTYYILVDNNSAGGSIPFYFHMLALGSSPPANDNCASAVTLTAAFNQNCNWSTDYTTECATPSPAVAGYPDPACAGFANGITGDIWFKFTPTFSGNLVIDLRKGSTGTTMNDGGMAVYTGSCGALVLNSCDDNSSLNANMPRLSLNVTNGVTYYIRVWAANGGRPGTFQICISSNCSQANDLPCNATWLTLGVPMLGDNTCSNGIGEPPTFGCGALGTPNTVWYKVIVPSGGQVIVRVSMLTLGDSQEAAYLFPSGCANAPVSSTLLACDDDSQVGSCSLSYDSYMTFNATPGDTVYIVVDGFASATGSFYITADKNTPLPPIYEKDCANPAIICNNTPFVINNPGLHGKGNICDFSSTSCGGSESGSTWVEFSVSAGSAVGFTITPNDSLAPFTNYDFVLWDITGMTLTNACSQLQSLSPIRCNYSAGSGKTGGRTPAGGTFADTIGPSGSVRTFVMCVSNVALDFSGTNIGFVLDWNIVVNGVPIGTTQISGASTSINWTGAIDTTYINTANYVSLSGCTATAPSCGVDVTISPAVRQPCVSGVQSARNMMIMPGATLTLLAGCNLDVCGDFTNLGNLVCQPGSTIRFTGSTNQVISGSLTGANGFQNLVITKPSGTAILNNNLDVNGNFTVASITSIFSINGRYMKLGGNFSNSFGKNTFTGYTNSTLEFNGAANQTYFNNADSTFLWMVRINKTGGDVLLSGVNSKMYVDSALTLVN